VEPRKEEEEVLLITRFVYRNNWRKLPPIQGVKREMACFMEYDRHHFKKHFSFL
jgi:hypothetical protein